MSGLGAGMWWPAHFLVALLSLYQEQHAAGFAVWEEGMGIVDSTVGCCEHGELCRWFKLREGRCVYQFHCMGDSFPWFTDHSQGTACCVAVVVFPSWPLCGPRRLYAVVNWQVHFIGWGWEDCVRDCFSNPLHGQPHTIFGGCKGDAVTQGAYRGWR